MILQILTIIGRSNSSLNLGRKFVGSLKKTVDHVWPIAKRQMIVLGHQPLALKHFHSGAPWVPNQSNAEMEGGFAKNAEESEGHWRTQKTTVCKISACFLIFLKALSWYFHCANFPHPLFRFWTGSWIALCQIPAKCLLVVLVSRENHPWIGAGIVSMCEERNQPTGITSSPPVSVNVEIGFLMDPHGGLKKRKLSPLALG